MLAKTILRSRAATSLKFSATQRFLSSSSPSSSSKQSTSAPQQHGATAAGEVEPFDPRKPEPKFDWSTVPAKTASAAVWLLNGTWSIVKNPKVRFFVLLLEFEHSVVTSISRSRSSLIGGPR
jgi:hypothetical protein